MANDQAAAATAAEEENTAANTNLINTFCEITSSSKEEALFFLESHNFDLDAAVSTYYETSVASADADLQPRDRPPSLSPSASASPPSASASPPSSPSRSRSPSPPAAARYNLRGRRSGKGPSGSRTVGGVHTLSDLNRPSGDGSGSDSDYEPPEYNAGGQKSGMHVQDPSKINDVDSIFTEAREAGAVEGPFNDLRPSSSSRRFTGTGRLLSGGTGTPAPQQPEVITHNIIFWSNGFTVDGGPLQRLDDPENAPFLESIRKSECPKELEPADKRTVVHVNLTRKEENCPVPEQRSLPFQGIGRTLGSTAAAEPTASTNSLNTAPPPSMGLIVDDSLPLTSIQLRLSDGTRMVSRFNFHHTIRDIRAFIDASRPSGPRTYQLQTVGFPPKQLTDLDQSIEQAGLANSVVIQRL